MLFRNRRPWEIHALGAYTPERGSGTLTLTVGGSERARVTVRGVGMLRASIEPVTVAPGKTARVEASGLAIQDAGADTAWARLAGFHFADRPLEARGRSELLCGGALMSICPGR